MALRIDESAARLVVRDRPSGQWVFGSIFVTSGLVLLTIIFSEAWGEYVLWERLAALAIGIGHVSIGSLYVTRYIETTTTFDRTNDQGICIRRRPFFWRAHITGFKVSDASALEILRSLDSDGDAMYQLRLWLAGSRVIWLQGHPTHRREHVEKAAAIIRQSLGLPDNAIPNTLSPDLRTQ